MNISHKDKISFLEKMILIRSFENAVSEMKNKKEIYGSVHCCNGEEAISVGVCSALSKEDYIISNHRPHGHAIAKGADINKLMAEILGTEAGCSGGRGGSMHIIDKECNMLISTGIVASGLPVACGVAFSSKYKNEGKVTCVFFGDGAANEGILHESLNLAAIWRLPVLFILEDNELAVTTNTRSTSACNDYVRFASAYGIEGYSIDGQDVENVFNTTKLALSSIKKNTHPVLIQAKTIRFHEHAEGEYYLRMQSRNYRDNNKLSEQIRNDCPIEKYKAKLLQGGFITQAEVESIYSKTQAVIERSIQFSRKSAPPNAKTAYKNIFV